MRHRRRLAATFALFLALAAGGCVILERLGLSSSRPIFSHTNHSEKEDLECKSCHKTFATADAAGMPKRRLCILCHEGIDEDKPAEKKIVNMFSDPPPWTYVTAISKEVIFSHKVHNDAKIACNECHRKIEECTDCEKAADRLRVDMKGCVGCHARQPLEEEISAAPPPAQEGKPAAFTPKRAPRAALVANDCIVCHREIRKDQPPESHGLAWKKRHGQTVRHDGGRTANQCSLCHTESSCSSCHREEAPANHTVFWKDRSHGVAARMDRSTCAVCHQSDACDRCHRETEPRSHVGSWGGRRSNHCLSCHGLARNEGCGLCHRGAPGHLEAEEKPSWHSAGMNCRSCHSPPPHADNGMDCNTCHR